MQQDGLSEKDHARVADYVQTFAGIQLPAHKRSLLESRLRKRQKVLGFGNLNAYVSHVFDRHDKDELIMLIDALTTNKTEFFREPVHFEVLEKEIRSRLESPANRSSQLRIWSAGCSSGEEPYTTSLVCHEIGAQHAGFDFTIFATDISVSVLKTAARGVYPVDRISPIGEALRRKYLYRSKNRDKQLIKMGPELRRSIRFSTLNLIQDDFQSMRDMDFIFCRNVMIYFCLKDRIRIVDKFVRSLKPGGILFLGHSETLPERHSNLTQILPTVYRKVS